MTIKKSKKPDNAQKEMRYVLSDMRIERRSDDEAPSRTIQGYASVFESWSKPIWGWFKEKIARGAFDDTDFSDCIACFNHRDENLLARTSSGTLKLEVDEKGLRFSFDAPNTTLGNDLLEMVERKDISQCSFVFFVESDEWIYADETNGLEYDERTIISFSKVLDVALVVRPAYEETEVSARGLAERKAEYLESKERPNKDSSNIRARHSNMTMKTKL